MIETLSSRSLEYRPLIDTFHCVDAQTLQPFDVGEMIRIGCQNDGGYVIPRALPELEILVSFGRGDNWSFEKDLIQKKLVQDFYVFDQSVSISIYFRRFVRR